MQIHNQCRKQKRHSALAEMRSLFLIFLKNYFQFFGLCMALLKRQLER